MGKYRRHLKANAMLRNLIWTYHKLGILSENQYLELADNLSISFDFFHFLLTGKKHLKQQAQQHLTNTGQMWRIEPHDPV